MNRVWEYISFVIWFLGLGYIVMWPLASTDHVTLSPALHLIGVASAVFIAVRLVLRAIARWRRTAAGRADAASALAARNSDAGLGPPRRKPARPLPTVKPRNHFGLRGMPR